MRIVNKEAVAAAENEGGNYFNTSGIYTMHLKGIELKKTTNGALQANYYFDKGNSFGNMLEGKDGKELFGYKAIDALAVIEDLESYGTSPEELEELVLTFKSGPKTVMVIPELSDIEVQAHIQYTYEVQTDGDYAGKMNERVSVKRFYRVSDGATSTEIVEEKEPGVRLATDLEKYASTVVYKGTDAEAVKLWKEEQAAERSGGATPAPAGNAAAAAGFGAKKGFGAPASQQ